jgi:hypothetical protein
MVMLFLCLSMISSRRGNTKLHAMSTSALDGGEWFAEHRENPWVPSRQEAVWTPQPGWTW